MLWGLLSYKMSCVVSVVSVRVHVSACVCVCLYNYLYINLLLIVFPIITLFHLSEQSRFFFFCSSGALVRVCGVRYISLITFIHPLLIVFPIITLFHLSNTNFTKSNLFCFFFHSPSDFSNIRHAYVISIMRSRYFRVWSWNFHR